MAVIILHTSWGHDGNSCEHLCVLKGKGWACMCLGYKLILFYEPLWHVLLLIGLLASLNFAYFSCFHWWASWSAPMLSQQQEAIIRHGWHFSASIYCFHAVTFVFTLPFVASHICVSLRTAKHQYMLCYCLCLFFKWKLVGLSKF